MSESRDANDPRDAMRGLRKEAREEFEREEARDTGGQEHASREEREGVAAARSPADAAARPRAASDAGALRVPREPPVADAAPVAPGPPQGKPTGRGDR